MTFFNKLKSGFKWIGDTTNTVKKWVGNTVKYAQPIGTTIGTGVSFFNPALGASIIAGSTAVGRGGKFISDKIDSVGKIINKTKSDGIQKIKRNVKRNLNFR